jgi:hypothetical protein
VLPLAPNVEVLIKFEGLRTTRRKGAAVALLRLKRPDLVHKSILHGFRREFVGTPAVDGNGSQ